MNQIQQLNEHDKKNLIFLLNLHQENLEECFNTFSEDDRKYASELMSYYSAWLSAQSSTAREKFEASLGDSSQWRESRDVLDSIMYRK